MYDGNKNDVVIKATVKVIVVACKLGKAEIVQGKDPLKLWEEAVSRMSTSILIRQAELFEEDDSGFLKEMGLIVKARLRNC